MFEVSDLNGIVVGYEPEMNISVLLYLLIRMIITKKMEWENLAK